MPFGENKAVKYPFFGFGVKQVMVFSHLSMKFGFSIFFLIFVCKHTFLVNLVSFCIVLEQQANITLSIF